MLPRDIVTDIDWVIDIIPSMVSEHGVNSVSCIHSRRLGCARIAFRHGVSQGPADAMRES